MTYESLFKDSVKNTRDYRPSFYRILGSTEARLSLSWLIEEKQPEIHNCIEDQLRDLYECRHPKERYHANEAEEWIEQHIGNTPLEEYGVWVYYPWSNQLVHLLDESEFIEVRSNRNLYKITPDEADQLSKKTIGIIGLSVGNIIARTMATERIAGCIRLADHDLIELSNLNRLLTGVSELGLSKTLVAARAIAETDPFIEVQCFPGLNEDNVQDFFKHDGVKLDLCIEECDSLAIKVLARQVAKEHKIPVLMETNERGMIDIERYDLEPEYPLFHNLVPEMSNWSIKDVLSLTNEEKVPYVIQILGEESISPRFCSSLLEINQSTKSWPQLASSVVLGGGMVCDIARRMLLGSLTISGRFFIDLHTLISDPDKEPIATKSPIKLGMMNETLIQNSPKERLDIGNTEIATQDLESLIRQAGLAPSARNNQPWRWHITPSAIEVYLERDKTSTDPNNDGDLVSLGASIENFTLAAQAKQYEVNTERFPSQANPKHIANLHLKKQATPTGRYTDALERFIPRRQTNRRIGSGDALSAGELDTLQRIVTSVPGASIQFLEHRDEILSLAEMIGETDRYRFITPHYHHELMDELRWSKEELESKRDGIDIDSLLLTPAQDSLIRIARHWKNIDMLQNLDAGRNFRKLSKDVLSKASAFALIRMHGKGWPAYFEGGRAIQRFWLQATQQELAIYPMSGLMFYLSILDDHEGAEMPDALKTYIHQIRPKYEALFGKKEGQVDVFMVSISKAPAVPLKSARYPIEKILSYDPALCHDLSPETLRHLD